MSANSPEHASAPRRPPVDYTTGISNRDFEEETIQIGRSEFEIVKPLANMLLDEREPAEPPSPNECLPSLPTTPCDPVSPARARIPAAPTPYTPTTLLARSTTSLSHFSPPTPSSAEGSGKNALDEYRAREAKWIAALSSMTPAQIRKSKKMRGLVQNGIPSSVRGKVWAYLAESERFVEPGLFQVRTHCPSDLQIIPMEYPGKLTRSSRSQRLCHNPSALPAVVYHDLLGLDSDSQFGFGMSGRSDLESVLLVSASPTYAGWWLNQDTLQAFVRCQPALGYYPGFAQIAATLLTHMPTESAFGTLVALVAGYGFHIFFASRRQDLEVELSVFSHLLEALEGRLARRLVCLPVPCGLLATASASAY